MLPASVAVNVNVAEVLATAPIGPVVIVVLGATVSTVHVREAGVASAFPAAIGRAHVEGVRALRQARVADRARAERRAVEAALERAARLRRGERERRAWCSPRRRTARR